MSWSRLSTFSLASFEMDAQIGGSARYADAVAGYEDQLSLSSEALSANTQEQFLGREKTEVWLKLLMPKLRKLVMGSSGVLIGTPALELTRQPEDTREGALSLRVSIRSQALLTDEHVSEWEKTLERLLRTAEPNGRYQIQLIVDNRLGVAMRPRPKSKEPTTAQSLNPKKRL